MTAKNANNLTLFVVFLIVFAVMSLALPDQFLSPRSLQNMARSLPEYGLLALGIMVAMTIGGIDLSVVSVVSLAGVITGSVLSQHEAWGMPPLLAIVLGIGAGLITAAACGLFNGVIISMARVPAIIATLGTNGLFFGLAIVITRGHGVRGFPLGYMDISNTNFLGIPIPFIIFLAIAGLLSLVLNRTSLGFQMNMLGSSPVAARFSGIKNRAVLLKSFMLIALLAGVAAIILTSKVATMRPNYGQTYLLVAVLLSLFGGTNPDGGFSSVLGVVLAILILAMLTSGLTMLGFTPFFKNFVNGALLLIVMVVHFFRRTGKIGQLTHAVTSRFRGARETGTG